MNQGIPEQQAQVDDRTPAAFADWTGADYDSHQVLASIGADNPAARVTRARAARRAVRTALRTVRRTVRTGAAA